MQTYLFRGLQCSARGNDKRSARSSHKVRHSAKDYKSLFNLSATARVHTGGSRVEVLGRVSDSSGFVAQAERPSTVAARVRHLAPSGASCGEDTPMTGPDALPRLLTADEAATLLRTSRRAVYAMAERAQLPGSIRIGRRLLIRRDEFLAWLGLTETGKRK